MLRAASAELRNCDSSSMASVYQVCGCG
jgi:hypothetical protein